MNINDIGGKYINFNVEINVKLAGEFNKDFKKVHKNVQLKFIDSCRFMVVTYMTILVGLSVINGKTIYKLQFFIASTFIAIV